MATKKYTREELESMLADMDNETDEDNDVDEIIVEENGRRFHIKGERATVLYNKLLADINSESTDDHDDQEPRDGERKAQGGRDDHQDEEPKRKDSTIWGRA